ncbi:hypothetical protein [Mangrovibacterium lignilyticum]|uniref:hypothetical protein n=1 Tax=Mangrovibacterium lignilyticum TaxID=2668052 RepID=UPI0013D085B8|nr:hypothetical protein [Mangrovibacterium lignilyticum]
MSIPKLIAFVVVCCVQSLAGFATVNGPQIIDFIGFDPQTNSILFTRTDWSDCDCPTELYTYHIDTDLLEVNSDWSPRDEYTRDKNQILQSKGLTYLAELTSAELPEFVLFSWEPEISYYSKIKEGMVVSSPFKISIFKQDYQYYQCSEESGEPNIIHLSIDSDSGLVFVNFQGDCYEGNWKDSLIYYSKKAGKTFSKKLSPDKLPPIGSYQIGNREAPK